MTIAIAPIARPRSDQTDSGLKATFLGLMGKVTMPLGRIDDARLVTTTGTVISQWTESNTTWLLPRSNFCEVGRVALDRTRALTIPAAVYAVGSRLEVQGVARTHRRIPFIAVRRLNAVG